jgi:hypothetical protein
MPLGRVLITLALISTIVGPLLADWNESHVFNPEWPPHARFHDVTGLSVTAGMALIGLWLLWRRSAGVRAHLVVASAIPLLACVSLLIAMLLPGTDVEDHAGETPRVFGFPLGPTLAVVFSAVAIVGYILTVRAERNGRS